MTALDHDANVAPWLRVAEDHDLVVRVAPVRTEDATLDVDALEALLGERTKVVAFTLASNAVGSVTDARRIAAAAHDVGALAWADAVHYAPHRRPDRGALGLDVLLCSPYKFFGPHLGIARSGATSPRRCRPTASGPRARSPPATASRPGRPRSRRSPGSSRRSGTSRALGDGDLDTAYERIRSHEEGLARIVLDGLGAIDGVTLYGVTDVARPHADVLLHRRRRDAARGQRAARRARRSSPGTATTTRCR